MRRARLLAVYALAAANLFSGCAGTRRYCSPAVDFRSTGFISEHCIQFTVSGTPDSTAESLVDRRESSFISAQQQLRGALAAYIGSSRRQAAVAGTPDAGITDAVIDTMLENSALCNEYYDESDRAYLVYQVCHGDLPSLLRR